MVDSFLAYRETERGNHAVTLRGAVTALKRLADFLVAEQVLPQNPLADLVVKLPAATGPAGVLTMAEMERLGRTPVGTAGPAGAGDPFS